MSGKRSAFCNTQAGKMFYFLKKNFIDWNSIWKSLLAIIFRFGNNGCDAQMCKLRRSMRTMTNHQILIRKPNAGWNKKIVWITIHSSTIRPMKMGQWFAWFIFRILSCMRDARYSLWKETFFGIRFVCSFILSLAGSLSFVPIMK